MFSLNGVSVKIKVKIVAKRNTYYLVKPNFRTSSHTMSEILFEEEYPCFRDKYKSVGIAIDDPLYLPIDTVPVYIDPRDSVAIIRDEYNDRYKCIPIKLLCKHRIIWDHYYKPVNYSFNACISPITITFCPYSRSVVIYENIWRYSNLMYNSNCIFVNEDNEYLQQLTGRLMNCQRQLTNIYPQRYGAEIYTWREWQQHHNYNKTIILKQYCYPTIDYNKIPAFYPIRLPLANTRYLQRNINNIGRGFFQQQQDNSKRGTLFLSQKTIENTQQYNLLITKSFHVQCCVGVWHAFFPFSTLV